MYLPMVSAKWSVQSGLHTHKKKITKFTKDSIFVSTTYCNEFDVGVRTDALPYLTHGLSLISHNHYNRSLSTTVTNKPQHLAMHSTEAFLHF